jgi:monoamine oxidase
VLTRPTDPDVWDCPIKDGSEIQEVFADYAICTIPFGVLRGLSLSGLSPAKTAAIRNLSYASSTKVLLHCRDRFWERGDKDSRIVGGASLSDEITRATYYPSDHAISQSVEAPTRSGKAGFRSLYTTFADPDQDAPASSLTEPGPGVLVGSYCWGQDARRLGSMSPADRAKVVIRVVSNFHGELPDQVDDFGTMFWDDFRWARGAFCFLRPNELRTLYPAAIRPEGRLHFAGEHCSMDQGWIQGALISSLRAVEEVVSARPAPGTQHSQHHLWDTPFE